MAERSIVKGSAYTPNCIVVTEKLRTGLSARAGNYVTDLRAGSWTVPWLFSMLAGPAKHPKSLGHRLGGRGASRRSQGSQKQSPRQKEKAAFVRSRTYEVYCRTLAARSLRGDWLLGPAAADVIVSKRPEGRWVWPRMRHPNFIRTSANIISMTATVHPMLRSLR